MASQTKLISYKKLSLIFKDFIQIKLPKMIKSNEIEIYEIIFNLIIQLKNFGHLFNKSKYNGSKNTSHVITKASTTVINY